MLQQAVRESAGGASHVEASFILWRYAEIFERAFEFQSASARIPLGFASYLNLSIGREAGARFFHALAVHANISREEHGLRSLARWRQAAFYEQNVEARLFSFREAFCGAKERLEIA